MDIYGDVVYGSKIENPYINIQCDHEFKDDFCVYCGQYRHDLRDRVHLQDYKPVWSHKGLEVFNHGFGDEGCVVGKSIATWRGSDNLKFLSDSEKVDIDLQLKELLCDLYTKPDYYIVVYISF